MPAAPPRCPTCGSPRIIVHPELDALSIAHLDCDAFYAAIEKRDDPSLKDKPVIVGGGRRGVASTACYVARLYGVRSAMPMFKALKLCPDAVVIRPNMAKYQKAGAEVAELMLATTPAVEPLSIDEAFLESLGGTFDLEPLRQEAEALSGGPSKPRRSGWHLYQAVEDYYSEVWPESGNADVRARAREAREKHGFFLVNVFQALRFMQLSGMLMVRRAAKRLLTEWNLEDVFSVEKILRAGVDGDLELLRDDDIITLREVSEVVEQLERRIRLFPGFFVYVYRPQEISDQDLAAMRKQFAELLADEFRVIVAGLKRKEME
jgi:hypothetical protein